MSFIFLISYRLILCAQMCCSCMLYCFLPRSNATAWAKQCDWLFRWDAEGISLESLSAVKWLVMKLEENHKRRAAMNWILECNEIERMHDSASCEHNLESCWLISVRVIAQSAVVNIGQLFIPVIPPTLVPCKTLYFLIHALQSTFVTHIHPMIVMQQVLGREGVNGI